MAYGDEEVSSEELSELTQRTLALTTGEAGIDPQSHEVATLRHDLARAREKIKNRIKRQSEMMISLRRRMQERGSGDKRGRG